MALKDELLTLIEAYADAKASENPYLHSLLAKQVGAFLQKVDIIAPVAVPPEVQAQVDAQLEDPF